MVCLLWTSMSVSIVFLMAIAVRFKNGQLKEVGSMLLRFDSFRSRTSRLIYPDFFMGRAKPLVSSRTAWKLTE